ncbi:MAG TPA: error-prone DNA polymerase [Verrucomicrobiae bacterium]|nr:error-prone DNA polymerase [Verrucomicrobiae bacterium]
MAYVELHARSAYSFLRGASSPEAMAGAAAGLGMSAVGLCDRMGVYGAPKLHVAGRGAGLRAIVGCELWMGDGSVLPVLVENREGYRNLCRLLTRAHLSAPKGVGRVAWADLEGAVGGLVCLTGDSEGPVRRALRVGGFGGMGPCDWMHRLVRTFGRGNVVVEVQRHRSRAMDREAATLASLAGQVGLPVVATNGACGAEAGCRKVLDVFACMRERTHLDAAGRLLEANAERHMKGEGKMRELFGDMPWVVEESGRLAERLAFSLGDLGYEFPRYPVPEGETAESYLERVTWAGARERYGEPSDAVRRQLRHELDVIGRLGFAGYFLIVWDIVNFCRREGILVQGRGSAANSAVCYSLGITAVDPVGSGLLFERFLSEGRQGWPDIDLDLPSGERRERVIQEVYRRYGPNGAAMTANVITFRGRSAAREIGLALNFGPDVLRRFSDLFHSGDFPHTLDLGQHLRMAGVARDHPRAAVFIELYGRIYGLPRHLGQHSGGMIVCQGSLDAIVPLENAAMPGRVVVQWDKEDCEDLGIIKVDLLGLGMMAVLEDAIATCARRGRPVDIAKIPKDDPATFEMMCRADTVGVFQIESRAQMATLPRMRPREFYDVVVEVALIRPGPIQGDLVHPYLARRQGKEPVTYFDERLRPVLERTLGVPLFQEQVLRMAMIMADFSGSEAEELRRALSFHRSPERMGRVTAKLRAAMARKGVAGDVIERIASSIGSFALYGFPESHAISFAILAYASAWLKAHRAPEFYCGLLNNQPMGFYSPATLVKDARRHGVRVLPVCAAVSGWDCGVGGDGLMRLGLRVVRGLSAEHGMALVEERGRRPFDSLGDLRRRVPLDRDELRALASIGAFAAFSAHRREALWRTECALREEDLFDGVEGGADGAGVGEMPLKPMTPMERLAADYGGTGLTVGPHPMALLRADMEARGVLRAADLASVPHGRRVRVAGQAICRQRPGSAKGFCFISLEDETGITNVIVTPKLFERLRLVIVQEPFLMVAGRLQNQEGVISVKADRVEPLVYPVVTAVEGHDFR